MQKDVHCARAYVDGEDALVGHEAIIASRQRTAAR
jgi:hypothetical protein